MTQPIRVEPVTATIGATISGVDLRAPLSPDQVKQLETLLGGYKHILVPEMNMGQLVKVLRAEYLVDAVGMNKIQGQPFKVGEITNRVTKMLEAL